jgi:hypothetical protein
VFSSVLQIPERKNFKEKRFIWAHDFRGFSPGLIGSIVSGLSIKTGGMK